MGHADNVSKVIDWNCVILLDMLWTLLCRVDAKRKPKGGGVGATTESNDQNYAKELSGNLITKAWQQKPQAQEHAARKMKIENQKQRNIFLVQASNALSTIYKLK